MDELHYLYALTLAGASAEDLGPGVDTRYAVELLPCGRIAAAASLVGTDRFDLAKIQEGTADVAWLSQVALRHNGIVQQLAQRGPVLPLRLGTLFFGKASLMEKLVSCESRAAGFLDSLGDRKEWAVKIYVDRARAEQALLGPAVESGELRVECQELRVERGELTAGASTLNSRLSTLNFPGAGARYLAGRREQLDRAALLRAAVGREISAVESRLAQSCPQRRRLRPLSSELTARPETMVWNGAMLASESQQHALMAACDRLKSDLAAKGLLLELTGPWPVYHFCEGMGLTG